MIQLIHFFLLGEVALIVSSVAQDATLSHKSETEEEEEAQSKPKIQPTRIKTRPWGTTESGQQNPNLLNQNPPLASQGWPTLGTGIPFVYQHITYQYTESVCLSSIMGAKLLCSPEFCQS